MLTKKAAKNVMAAKRATTKPATRTDVASAATCGGVGESDLGGDFSSEDEPLRLGLVVGERPRTFAFSFSSSRPDRRGGGIAPNAPGWGL